MNLDRGIPGFPAVVVSRIGAGADGRERFELIAELDRVNVDDRYIKGMFTFSRDDMVRPDFRDLARTIVGTTLDHWLRHNGELLGLQPQAHGLITNMVLLEVADVLRESNPDTPAAEPS